MSEPSEPNQDASRLREQIIGLGSRSLRKSYYPQLQQQIDELLKTKAALEQQSAVLLSMVEDLEAARQRAEESERKFWALFNQISDGVLVTSDWTAPFLLSNQAISSMLGYSKEELRRLSVSDIHPPEGMPFAKEHFALLNKGIPGISREIPVKRKDGSVFYADINASPIEFDHKRYILGVFRDVTERKKSEDFLLQAKESAEAANRAKDQFLAVLSHELRTPLTPVLATVTAIQHKDLPLDVREDFELIRRNVQLEASLIDDLLDVTRISRGKVELHLETINVHDCLRTALEICQSEIEAKHLQISLNLIAVQPHVRGDPGRLRQVFWNLLKNAVKFTPEEGQINLRTVNVENRVKIEITDTGVGIAPEVMPRIFDAFEQGEQTKSRRFGGLGLGLSIAKAVVDLHHGTLTASSGGADQGATFTVELETALPSAETPPVAPPPIPKEAKSRKILLVEDHLDTLNILSRLLQKSGCQVTTAVSVRSALEKASKEPFDLLISDLGLPDGSGLEIMRRMKKLYRTPGIALSGYGTEEDVTQSRSAGFEEHLTKPIDFQALSAAMKRSAMRHG